MTTGKTMALTFVDKVISLLFNMLSRLIMAFLPRSKRLSISWLQSPPAAILEPKKIKFDTVSIVSKLIKSFPLHEFINTEAIFLYFVCSLHIGYLHMIIVCNGEGRMAPYSSTVAWKIPWMEEPGRLQSIGLLRVEHD